MDADRAIAALAERQHGLVTRPQALERGLTESAIGRRLAAGRWKRVHSGVYRLAGAERTWEQELRAHLLAAGPGAVASHRSAATLLGLPGIEPKFEITVARCHTYTGAGLEVHRASLVEGVDRARRRGAAAVGLHTAPFMASARHIYESLGLERVPALDIETPGAPPALTYRLNF